MWDAAVLSYADVLNKPSFCVQFELETRIELMKRAIKFTERMIKKTSASGKRLSDEASPFQDVKDGLETILVHLQNLSSPELLSEPSGISEVIESLLDSLKP